MQIQTQNFASLVDGMSATIQGTCATTLNLSVGSVARALVEASASVALWLQYLIMQVLSLTRLSTSTGADLDSWVGDFGLSRLGAPTAVGSVTMTSFNPSAQASTIASGTLVRSGDGTVTFAVTGGPYTRPIGATSVTVPCACLVSGTIGNVQANVISVLGSAVPGIDTVDNAEPFSGGGEAESDGALRARFATYINNRSQATAQAIEYAVRSVKQTLSCTTLEGMTVAGVTAPGTVSVIVADGGNVPDPATLQAASKAIDLVRPLGIVVSVVAPQVVTVDIVVVVAIDRASLAGQSGVQESMQTLISGYVSMLGVGQALRISRLYGLCYQASPAVNNVDRITVNGNTGDVGGGVAVVVALGAISISSVSS